MHLRAGAKFGKLFFCEMLLMFSGAHPSDTCKMKIKLYFQKRNRHWTWDRTQCKLLFFSPLSIDKKIP